MDAQTTEQLRKEDHMIHITMAQVDTGLRGRVMGSVDGRQWVITVRRNGVIIEQSTRPNAEAAIGRFKVLRTLYRGIS